MAVRETLREGGGGGSQGNKGGSQKTFRGTVWDARQGE